MSKSSATLVPREIVSSGDWTGVVYNWELRWSWTIRYIDSDPTISSVERVEYSTRSK
jgi:hypothetical protein